MRLIVCSAEVSGKAPVPFPSTPKNHGFISGRELSLVHLPTPHALTTLHRSCKAAGSKGLEGSSWETWSTKKFPGRKQDFSFFGAASQGRFSDRAAQQSYPWLSQQQNEDPLARTSDVICKKIKCGTLVYQMFPMWLCASLNWDSSQPELRTHSLNQSSSPTEKDTFKKSI